MKLKKCFIFLLIFSSCVSSCALPTPRPSAPDTIQNGGTKEDAFIASAARLTQIVTEKTPEIDIHSNEILFECEVFLKNETVSNKKICQGIAFNLIDSHHKKMKRIFPNEFGVFIYKATALSPSDEAYTLTLENKSWTLKKHGPFYTGRKYSLILNSK